MSTFLLASSQHAPPWPAVLANQRLRTSVESTEATYQAQTITPPHFGPLPRSVQLMTAINPPSDNANRDSFEGPAARLDQSHPRLSPVTHKHAQTDTETHTHTHIDV